MRRHVPANEMLDCRKSSQAAETRLTSRVVRKSHIQRATAFLNPEFRIVSVAPQHRPEYSPTRLGSSLGGPHREGTTYVVVLQSSASRRSTGHLDYRLSADRRLTNHAHDNAAIIPLPSDSAPTLSEILTLLHSRFGGAGLTTTRDGGWREPVVVDARPLVPERLLRFDELTIDVRRREVRVDGKSIALTKSEFDLLAVLADQPGIVFSRREIVLAYKGIDYPVDDRSIDVQMVNVRRKLGRAATRLQTIRGVGYRFVADSALVPGDEKP